MIKFVILSSLILFLNFVFTLSKTKNHRSALMLVGIMHSIIFTKVIWFFSTSHKYSKSCFFNSVTSVLKLATSSTFMVISTYLNSLFNNSSSAEVWHLANPSLRNNVSHLVWFLFMPDINKASSSDIISADFLFAKRSFKSVINWSYAVICWSL